MTGNEQVAIFGAGVTAEVLVSLLRDDPRYEVVACTVSDELADGNSFRQLPLYGFSDFQAVFRDRAVKVINAVGYRGVNANREATFRTIVDAGFQALTYVHRDAAIYDAAVEMGAIVLPGTIVEAHSRIGRNAVLWSGVTVSHHVAVEDNCWLASGTVVAGNATIGRNSFLGVNATISDGVVVGARNIVGANSLVAQDTGDDEVWPGKASEKIDVPSKTYARIMKL